MRRYKVCTLHTKHHGKVNAVTLDEALSRPTIPIPDAGAVFFGLARSGSYEAARKGDIPIIEVGGRKLAVVAAIAAKLGLETKFARAA